MDLEKMIRDKIGDGVANTQAYIEKNYGPTYQITMVAHWRAWCSYALLFGQSQTYQRISDRGGFGESELDAFYPEWRNHIVK